MRWATVGRPSGAGIRRLQKASFRYFRAAVPIRKGWKSLTVLGLRGRLKERILKLDISDGFAGRVAHPVDGLGLTGLMDACARHFIRWNVIRLLIVQLSIVR